MTDFFEIDFLDVESRCSGDAIPLTYRVGQYELIHVVDGGFLDTGDKVCEHIRKYYGNPKFIDHVVVTHPDGDHAAGLRKVLEEFEIGMLWMLRPWIYAAALIPLFTKFSSVENLKKRLREIYPNIDALEKIAHAKGINIAEPFQGADIGAFRVLGPTQQHYFTMLLESERTPESVKRAEEDALIVRGLGSLVEKFVNIVKSGWGFEVFSAEETSAENEMSVVQYAELCEERILLTGDAGRKAMKIAADYATSIGIQLPGIDRFQVPHHGSRRNVSSELLDRWLGPKKASEGQSNFTAIISAAKMDRDHPRKAVVRACMHRGARVISTEGRNICCWHNPRTRSGWGSVTPLAYPNDQED